MPASTSASLCSESAATDHRAGAATPRGARAASRTTLASRSSASSRSILERRWSSRPRLNVFWWTQGKLREGIGWLERAREAAPDAPAELRATALLLRRLSRRPRHRRLACRRPGSIDVGIDALANAQRTAADPRHAALPARRVRRLQRRSRRPPSARTADRARDFVAVTRRHSTRGPRASACGTSAPPAAPSGTRTPLSRSSRRCAEIASAARLRHRGDVSRCNALGEIWEARGVLDTSRAFWERALRCRRELGAVRLLVWAQPCARLDADRRCSRWRAWPQAGRPGHGVEALARGLPIAEEMRDEATATADRRAPAEDVAGRADAARDASAGGRRVAHRLQRHERPRAGPEGALAPPRARRSAA